MSIKYRPITEKEIGSLERQGCTSSDWSKVYVVPNFVTQNIKNSRFSGNIKIGLIQGVFSLPGGFEQSATLENVAFHNCDIGNAVYIGHVQNYIANYKIGAHSYIRNVNSIYVDGESSFGNGTSVAVMNETGGREIIIYDNLNAHLAYIYTFYRYNPILIDRIKNMILAYVEKLKSFQGTIGKHCIIVDVGAIKGVRVGDYTSIEGARLLENGSINSTQKAPVHIGYSVVANDFIISSGTKITDGVMLRRCFIGQTCRLGHTYSATDSVFFSNCQGENGEAASIFAGPFTVTHHKSTLLIAGMFSFMNAGSGSNQSNHMYKLGAIHQGIVERGGKTTSNSYILWPARIGAYSLIMGRHTNNSDTSNLPFSYLIENNDETILIPGVNLRSVGTIRDAIKFPKRDNRKDDKLLDYINFNLLSPYTVQKMFKGVEILNKLKQTCGETADYYTYQGCKIKASSLNKGLYYYDLAIKKFLGNSIISRLNNDSYDSIVDIRLRLKPSSTDGVGEWRDLAGLIASEKCIIDIIDQITSNKIDTIEQVNNSFYALHKNYYNLEWDWAWEKIKEYFNLELDSITVKDIIYIVSEWKEAVITLDKLLYTDAKKEFSLSSRISFGLDGNRYTQKIDFDRVRGVFEENEFVKTILKHIDVKTNLGNDFLEKMEALL